MSQLVVEKPAAINAPRSDRGQGLTSALRKAFSFPVMLHAWLVLIIVRLAEKNLPDVDIWWHLRNAQYLFTHHRLPNFDTYSFTVAGHPWINPEWLAEIPYYLAWRALGLEGIEILMLAVLEVIFLGVLYLCYMQSKHIKASILACWLAAFLGTINFGPRTALFGYACLVILLVILERFRSNRQAPLWLLPPLFCLWINLHGSWCLGMAVLGIFVACGLLEVEWGMISTSRWPRPQLHQLLAAFAVSCTALFVNPYGYHLVLYPLDMVFRQRLNVASIQEWAPVDFHGPRGIVVLVMMAGLFCSALLMRHRWRLTDLVLVLVALYGGLSHERLLFFAGIIVAPVIAELLEVVPYYRSEIDKPWLNAAIICGILAFVVLRFPGPAQLEQQVAEQYPAEVLSYLQSHPPSGNVLNFYEWGGYLGWKDPGLKVFMDSRVDIFEYAGVFKDYLDLIGFRDPMRILGKYRIRYVLFPRDAPLVILLRANSKWKVDFDGRLSVVMERVGPMPADPPTVALKDGRLRTCQGT
jgi:hypothetical protein